MPYKGKTVRTVEFRDITEAKEYADRLRENEALLKNITENMHDLVALTDMQGNFKFVAKSHNILGYESEYLIGRNVMEFVHPEDISYVTEGFIKWLTEGQESAITEYRYRCADGSYIWLETVGRLIRDAEGNVKELIFSSRDVTERKKVEDELLTSKRELDIIFNTVPAWIWVKDLSEKYLRINKKYCESVGKKAEIIMGKTDYELFPQEIADKYVGDDEKLFSSGKSILGIEEQYIKESGEIGWVRTDKIIMRDSDDNITGSIGFAIDITGRKNAEDKLRESEFLLKNAQSMAGLGNWALNVSTGELIWSDEIYRIFGLDSEKFKADYQNFLEIIHPEDVDAVNAAYTASIAEGRDFYEIDHRIIRADNGQIAYVHEKCEHIRDDSGTIISSLGMVQDITVRKRVEKYRELSGHIFSILNSEDDLKDSVSRILLLIKENTGSDAVGIRLCEGEDYPYFIQTGFSNNFLLEENSIISRDICGDICVNNDGDVSLECTCGLLISGKTDPENPLFTPGGSCWTNDSFPLLEMPESEDPRYKARNNCIHHGYASVVLVPVKSKNKIVGLLQLNGHAKNLFTIELVQELEMIAGRIGETLLRKQNEDKIRALLQEKELLLKETHHRVKNNMNTVYGLLYMQADELNDLVSKNIIMEAASRVQSMMVMYDKLYRSENHHEMNVNHYLPSLVDEIISIFDYPVPVKTEINVADIILSAKTLSALGIIINELITNSMKYAFHGLDEGLIGLSLTEKDKKVTVVYRDNGPGLPESVNFENSTGFGMQLVNMLVQQIDGSISIERGEGTRFVIEFGV